MVLSKRECAAWMPMLSSSLDQSGCAAVAVSVGAGYCASRARTGSLSRVSGTVSSSEVEPKDEPIDNFREYNDISNGAQRTLSPIV